MKTIFRLQHLLIMLVTLIFLACSDDETPITPEPPPPNLAGVYIYGTNTIAALATDEGARMNAAVLDPNQGAKVASMDGVVGKFLYIGAGGKIKFTEVVDGTATVYGAENGGSVDSASVVGNIPLKDKIIHGTLLANGPEINVAEDGLYYAFVNTNTDTFILMKVRAQMIGDATVPQWAAGTSLGMKSVSKDSAVFEGTNIDLRGASGYRFRFNDGWHVYQDPNLVTMSSLGVPSYGEAWDTGINNIGFHLDNIPHKEDGLFTIRLKYDAKTDTWTEKKIKTGNRVVDYSDTEMGLFGNAYLLAVGDTAGWVSGEDGYGLHVPVKSGTVYTWTWSDVSLIEDREFIFLEDGAWGGVQLDYTGATVGGTAVTDSKIKNAKDVGGEFANFFVEVGGVYDIALVIDATASTKTITITPN